MLSMGWLVGWRWCSASKKRLRPLCLMLSQSLCFSQNYWCMSGLEKQRGKHQKFFWSAPALLFFSKLRLNVSTGTLISVQVSNELGGRFGNVVLWFDQMGTFLASQMWWLWPLRRDLQYLFCNWTVEMMSGILIRNITYRSKGWAWMLCHAGSSSHPASLFYEYSPEIKSVVEKWSDTDTEIQRS